MWTRKASILGAGGVVPSIIFALPNIVLPDDTAPKEIKIKNNEHAINQSEMMIKSSKMSKQQMNQHLKLHRIHCDVAILEF